MIISKWDGIRLTEQRICLTTAEQLASEMFIDLNVVLRLVSSWALQHPFAAYSGAVQNVRFALAGPGGSASFIPRGIFISQHLHFWKTIHVHKCHLLKLLYMIDKGRESLLLWGAYRKHVLVCKEIKFQIRNKEISKHLHKDEQYSSLCKWRSYSRCIIHDTWEAQGGKAFALSCIQKTCEFPSGRELQRAPSREEMYIPRLLAHSG